METLKYLVIKDQRQYDKYCQTLENLITEDETKYQDEIDLLTMLIIPFLNKQS